MHGISRTFIEIDILYLEKNINVLSKTHCSSLFKIKLHILK